MNDVTNRLEAAANCYPHTEGLPALLREAAAEIRRLRTRPAVDPWAAARRYPETLPRDLEAENFALAARQCRDPIADEGGSMRCGVIDDQAERIRTLEKALRLVRSKAIPAGGAAVRGNEDWRERVMEVLDIIDNALGSEPGSGLSPGCARSR